MPREKEAERALRIVLDRYVAASWVPETDRWINPHYFPNECYLKDKKLGVSIEYNRVRKTVASITRWDASRSVASVDKNEKPPQFCIDNSCAPAIPAEQFFKEISVAQYCEYSKPKK